MAVWVTADAAPDWLQRLVAAPQIQHLINAGGDSCFFEGPIHTPTPGKGSFLGAGAPAIPSRVQFAPEVSYDQALATITNLGFRLINVCGELAPSGTAWRPEGQKSVFAASHALEIATTFASSTLWQTQLNHTAGVTSVQADDTPVC